MSDSDEFWEGLLSGVEFDQDELRAKLNRALEARRIKWEQDAARESLSMGLQRAGAENPLIAVIAMASERLSEALETELEGMSLPFLWADENEATVRDFIYGEAGKAFGDDEAKWSEYLSVLSVMKVEYEKSVFLLDGGLDHLSPKPQIPEMGRLADEWLLLSSHELYRASVLALAVLASTKSVSEAGDVKVVAENALPVEVAELALRIYRVYKAMAEEIGPAIEAGLSR